MIVYQLFCTGNFYLIFTFLFVLYITCFLNAQEQSFAACMVHMAPGNKQYAAICNNPMLPFPDVDVQMSLCTSNPCYFICCTFFYVILVLYLPSRILLYDEKYDDIPIDKKTVTIPLRKRMTNYFTIILMSSDHACLFSPQSHRQIPPRISIVKTDEK